MSVIGATWLRPTAVVAAVLAIVVAGIGATRLLSDSDEPGWTSDGITLNTSSWEPGDDENDALGISTVSIDANGCVHLESLEGWITDFARDVVWPAGYTASRESDGTVTISNPDGVVVAATGRRLEAGGGQAPPDTELACRAQDTTGTPPFMIQDELPPLKN
jgi:hypothetical protein